MNREVFTLNVMASSSLKDLTASLRHVLNQIYEEEHENALVILCCEHMKDACFDAETVQVVSAWEKALRQLEMARAVIVFISEGDVFGHSFDLLLISDVRIVHRESQLGFSLQRGLARPRMSLYRLTNQIGQAHARRLGLAGKTFTAEEAYSVGLADEILENASEMLDCASAKFRDSPSSDVAIRRRLILEAHALEYDNALGAYLAAYVRDPPGTSA